AKREGVMGNQTPKGLWVAAIAALALVASSAHAADISCNVPFSFSVGKATLPAGHYAVSTTGTGALIFRGVQTGPISLTNRLESRKQTDAKMVFYRYGDRYVLREVWTGGGAGRELLQPRQESEPKAAKIDFERIEIPIVGLANGGSRAASRRRVAAPGCRPFLLHLVPSAAPPGLRRSKSWSLHGE